MERQIIVEGLELRQKGKDALVARWIVENMKRHDDAANAKARAAMSKLIMDLITCGNDVRTCSQNVRNIMWTMMSCFETGFDVYLAAAKAEQAAVAQTAANKEAQP